MIYTITLNPCVDMTISCNGFSLDSLNFVSSKRFDPVGKGINVSRILKILNMQSTALGFVAGATGVDIVRDLNLRGIKNDFFMLNSGETRTNIKILDTTTGTQTEINELGPTVPQEFLQLLKEKLSSLVKAGDYVVMSGRVPPGLSNNVYRELILHIKDIGAKAVLDASGDALVEGIKAFPSILKPNIHELKQINDFDDSNIGNIKNAAKNLLTADTEMVLVSMGDRGSLFVSRKEELYMPVILVDISSCMGAGDSVVAGFLFGLTKGLDLEESLKLSQGCGAAMVTTEGTQTPSIEQIMELKDKAVVKNIV